MADTITTVEKLLLGYSCETNIAILVKAFSDFSIKEYFKILLKELKIDNFEEFSKLKESDIKSEELKLFFYNCKLTSLIFEGSYHSKLSYSDTQIALIAGLYCGLFKRRLFELVPEKNSLDEDQYKKLFQVLDKTALKHTSDLNAVLIDAFEMYPYWCQSDYPIVLEKISKHNKTMYDLDISVSINVVIVKLHQISWKTRWAKIKSFNRNYPSIVNKLKSLLDADFPSNYNHQ